MILSVRVSPKASRNLIKEDGGRLRAYVTKPSRDGLANEQLIELLAEYFHLRKMQVKIIKGHKSRDKLIEIDGPAFSLSK